MSNATDLRCPGPYQHYFGTQRGDVMELHCRDCSRARTKQRPGERIQVFHRYQRDASGTPRRLPDDREIVEPGRK